MAILLLGVAGPAQADPITYTQSGIATGTIGGTTFADALVTWTMHSDTDNVVPNSEFEDGGEVIPAGLYFINVSSLTTVDIAGIGTALVTDRSAVYGFPIPVDINDDGTIDPPLVVFGTIDDFPVLESFTGLGGIGSDALAGYDLRTAIGPITAPGGVGHPPSLSVNTSLGALRFASNVDFSDRGTFTATTVPVSVLEPGSLLLLGTGLVSLVGARSRFRDPRRTTSK
jgi:hypothetical protein